MNPSVDIRSSGRAWLQWGGICVSDIEKLIQRDGDIDWVLDKISAQQFVSLSVVKNILGLK